MSLFLFSESPENSGFQRGFQKEVSSLNCIRIACLTDLNSTNSTFLNGSPLDPNREYPVQEGDEIKLGRAMYIFSMVEC